MPLQILPPPISFQVEDIFLHPLQKLPWEYPIEIWRELGVKHLNIKRGIGRHPVVFVQVDGRNFVVKELGLENAQNLGSSRASVVRDHRIEPDLTAE